MAFNEPMAFNEQTGASSHAFRQPGLESLRWQETGPQTAAPPSEKPQFDIFTWYPNLQSCHKYFLDHAQHSGPVQALATFLNITLPCNKEQNPVISSNSSSPLAGSSLGAPPQLRQASNPFAGNTGNPQAVSLIPYIRRLVATGFDQPAVLHGFFGDRWAEGVGPLHETERRNYMFAAKSSSWLKVKSEYDMGPHETVPFLKPLQDATEKEIAQAEASWSEWLAMQDWMVGPRAPSEAPPTSSRTDEPSIKREPRG